MIIRNKKLASVFFKSRIYNPVRSIAPAHSTGTRQYTIRLRGKPLVGEEDFQFQQGGRQRHVHFNMNPQ